MAELIIFTLIASLIGTTLVFNHFINKSLAILEGKNKEYLKAIERWTFWAGPFVELNQGDMADIYKLIKVLIDSDDPEEIECCKKALAEILKNEPVTAKTLCRRGESNAN